MFSGLQLKLLMSLGVIIIVLSAYLYVGSLQHKITNLNHKNETLTVENQGLKETIKEDERIQGIIDSVSKAGDIKRQEIIATKNSQLQKIDQNVNKGNDKPVGKLLKDFLNDE